MKHNICILLHMCSATVRFLYSADSRFARPYESCKKINFFFYIGSGNFPGKFQFQFQFSTLTWNWNFRHLGSLTAKYFTQLNLQFQFQLCEVFSNFLIGGTLAWLLIALVESRYVKRPIRARQCKHARIFLQACIG